MAEYFSSSSIASVNSCTSSRWLTEEVFKLIDLVQRDEAIYNPRHKYYFCRPYVENFWKEVDQKLEKNPGASLAKWTNLRISFRREYTNYLEEKVPPCWSYFDRMFFLHPFLRRKQQPTQNRSIDSQVQDALVQISSLSNRLQRERVAAAALSHITTAGRHVSAVHPNSHNQTSNVEALDNYFDYLDEVDHNISEAEDIIDEEHADRYRSISAVHSISNDVIKSECEDVPDDYETAETRQEVDIDVEPDDISDMRNFVLSALEKRQKKESSSRFEELSHQQANENLDDLEEVRAKRPRSEESISSTQNNYFVHSQARSLCASTPAHTSSNVSFVRPTLAKPLETVSTTSNLSDSLERENSSCCNIATSTSAATSTSSLMNYHHESYFQQQRQQLAHNQSQPQHLHIESTMLTNNRVQNPISNGLCNDTSVSSHTPQPLTPVALATVATPHADLCDCKIDPDAMFLMSLLPDIQKLNGRDRGKIKIAFQNILQDFLYPD